MIYNKLLYSFFLLYCYAFMSIAIADEFGAEIQTNSPNMGDSSKEKIFDPYLKLNKNGIKVYVYRSKNSKFATFKAITHIKASIDSIISVLLDLKSSSQWIDSSKKTLLIERLNFNEQYHYQTLSIPFPFSNRDFILHSTMKHNPSNRAITITTRSVPDYCHNKESAVCTEVNQSTLVRVNKSVSTFKLEPDENGTNITWIQFTDPSGYLPSWLVNQLIKNTPYNSFKNLSEKVQQEPYKFARLIYDINGIAINIGQSESSPIDTSKIAKDFGFYPTF